MPSGSPPPAIQVHLCVTKGVEAIRFYERAFDGVCTQQHMAEDGARVMHAVLDLFGSEIMLHDEFPEFGGDVLSPASRDGASLTITIQFARPAEVDAAMARAAKAGATVTLPAADVFWGARYGKLRDPFGHVWAFNAPLC